MGSSRWPLQEMAVAVQEVVLSKKGAPDAFKVVGSGADGNETLTIDRLAERALLDYIEARDLPLNVLSEEIGYIDRGEASTLVVDPIDGTYNCSHGIPFYGLSLAVGDRRFSDVQEALVRNLVTGDEYVATKGGGATLNGRPIRTRAYKDSDSLYCLYSGRTATERAHRLTTQPRRVRSLGSAALEICMVAQGSADLFFQDGLPLRITDLAAPGVVLREAGGELYTFECSPLEMALSLEDRKEVLALGDTSALGRLYADAMELHGGGTCPGPGGGRP
jgi:fructose-1,6-bisphosphatase/inositol monophosphatase family enzyme